MDTLNTLFITDNFKMLYLWYNQIIMFSESTFPKVFNGIILYFLPYLEISVILARNTKPAYTREWRQHSKFQSNLENISF
jgi:uncharacterized membrane protein